MTNTQAGHDANAREDDAVVRPRTRAKFAQIRTDQWTDLDVLARNLQDARMVRSERITANTLIRVAIDGLLAHAQALHGDTEAELRDRWLALLDTATK